MNSTPSNAPVTPLGPEDLTAEWLTFSLQQGGALKLAKVRSFDAHELGVGQGFTGRLARVTFVLDQEEPDAPTSVIAKFPALPGQTRDLANRFRLYDREMHFYQELAGESGVPTPRLYFGKEGSSPGEFVMLLQDMAPAQAGDLLTGCGLEAAQKLVILFAKLHAKWWGSPELDRLTWLPAPNDSVATDFVDLAGGNEWGIFKERYGEHLPPKIASLGLRISNDRTILDRLSLPPRTLVHADVRINNLMFSDDAGLELASVIDWQTATKGRGPMDVASLLTSSLQPEDRRAGEQDLLRTYHQTLLEHGVDGYSLEECMQDYRLAVINQFSQVVFLSSILDIDEQLEDDVGPATGARLLAALLDIEDSEFLPRESAFQRIVAPLQRFVGRIA
jgi:hypothetical protein